MDHFAIAQIFFFAVEQLCKWTICATAQVVHMCNCSKGTFAQLCKQLSNAHTGHFHNFAQEQFSVKIHGVVQSHQQNPMLWGYRWKVPKHARCGGIVLGPLTVKISAFPSAVQGLQTTLMTIYRFGFKWVWFSKNCMCTGTSCWMRLWPT